ncbi:DNA-directed RNA polymerase subunit beta [Frondihabitans sp. PAMC 28766]|uniref:DNA-directed RNA polymerase subunit beta n=1 Tax=Frondihabitans sp. PAMC 28766 TaxID=1795630 RepID=UPI00078D953E|nr:DNA-directed RNA polymerase subunit beta [Frondihabitans sp. PAMC 28766]AMM19905.1 DNA-directed RNA polymerase subunit beta [Frondihabitans sp. PAMC 28766]
MSPRDFHRPAQFSGHEFEAFQGGDDPAVMHRVAHESANALLARVRQDPRPEILDRLVAFTDSNGIDALAELWAGATPHSLPGALWRIYLARAVIRANPDDITYLFERGVAITSTIDPVVAGAPAPATPEEILELADRILRGVFDGDFGLALDRGAAFCRLASLGATSVADDLDVIEPDRSQEFTRRALRLSELAHDLSACAALWRDGSLS